MPEVLAGLDVLVSLSGGSVCYEAMMCGVPVISAWSRRLEETLHLRDRETGFVIPEKSEAAVVSVLLELIEQDALRERIGQKARQRALVHLQHTVLVAQTQRLYDRLSGSL